MSHSELCKFDCYGILKGYLEEGLEGEELLNAFKFKFIELSKGSPGCYCDKVLNDLIKDGVKQEELLDKFKEKQELVVKGYQLMIDEAIKLAKELPDASEDKEN